MAERTCLWCGTSIEHRAKDALFCCRAHLQKHHYWQHPEKCRARNRRPPPPPKACAECFQEFVRVRGSKYCSRKCSQARNNRLQSEQRRRRHERTFECGFCGASITTRSGVKKYCNSTCRKRSGRSKNPGYKPFYAVEHDLVGKRCRKCGDYKLYSEFGQGRAPGLYKANCKECHSIMHRAHRYALTEEEVRQLMKVNRCEICGSAVAMDSAHIDHCHTTGAVRGVLCYTCNTGIGGLQDSPELLSSAAQYLLRNVDVLAMAGQLTGREDI